MSLTFQALADKLAPGAVEFVGNNQLKVNFSQLTGDQGLTFESSCLKGIVKLLQGLAELTDEINQERAKLNPPLAPIEFVTQKLTGTAEKPKYQFTLEVEVNTSAFANNLVDPV